MRKSDEAGVGYADALEEGEEVDVRENPLEVETEAVADDVLLPLELLDKEPVPVAERVEEGDADGERDAAALAEAVTVVVEEREGCGDQEALTVTVTVTELVLLDVDVVFSVGEGDAAAVAVDVPDVFADADGEPEFVPFTMDAVAEEVSDRSPVVLLVTAGETEGVTERVGLPLEHALAVELRVAPSEALIVNDVMGEVEADELPVELGVDACERDTALERETDFDVDEEPLTEEELVTVPPSIPPLLVGVGDDPLLADDVEEAAALRLEELLRHDVALSDGEFVGDVEVLPVEELDTEPVAHALDRLLAVAMTLTVVEAVDDPDDTSELVAAAVALLMTLALGEPLAVTVTLFDSDEHAVDDGDNDDCDERLAEDVAEVGAEGDVEALELVDALEKSDEVALPLVDAV